MRLSISSIAGTALATVAVAVAMFAGWLAIFVILFGLSVPGPSDVSEGARSTRAPYVAAAIAIPILLYWWATRLLSVVSVPRGWTGLPAWLGLAIGTASFWALIALTFEGWD